MNLPLMIWRRLLGTATAAQLTAVVAELKATRAELSELKAATQTRDEALAAKLDQIIDLLTLPPAEALEIDVVVYAEAGGSIERTERGTHTVTMTNSQRAQLSIRPVDRRQKPAKLDGAPVWATSDPTVATITPGLLNPDGSIGSDPDPQGLSAVLEGVAEGTCRITVSGDADLDQGETATITGVLEVVITAGQAISIAIDAGSPVEMP